MSIFKRNDEQRPGEALAPEATAQGGVATATRVTPAPGVVPPAAAPIYSTRLPEHAPRAVDGAVSETVTVAAEAHRKAREGIQGSVAVAVRRSRSTNALTTTRGRQVALQPTMETRPAPTRPPMSIDPSQFAQTGLLNLAWSWQRAGAPIRAIHAYMQLLDRYPGTPAAAAAVADLVEISDRLARDGQFHTALAIYDQLEELLA